MNENLELPDLIVTLVIDRIRFGGTFSTDEIDYLLVLSSRAIDRIVEDLDADQISIFAGLLKGRQEQLASQHAEAIANFRGG